MGGKEIKPPPRYMCHYPDDIHDGSEGLSLCVGCGKFICKRHWHFIKRYGRPALPYCDSCNVKVLFGDLVVPDREDEPMEQEELMRQVAETIFEKRFRGKTEAEQKEAIVQILNVCGAQFDRPGAGSPLMAMKFAFDMGTGQEAR